MQGEYVIFVGEGECGCTADDAFFELMEVGCIQYLAEALPNRTVRCLGHSPVVCYDVNRGVNAQEEWHLVETVDIPCWPEIHDRVQIYRRGST